MNDADHVTLRDFILVQLKAVEDRMARIECEAKVIRSQGAMSISRAEYELHHSRFGERIQALEDFRANLQGRILATGAVIGILLVVVEIAIRYWH